MFVWRRINTDDDDDDDDSIGTRARGARYAPLRRHTPWVASKVLHSTRESRRFDRFDFDFSDDSQHI